MWITVDKFKANKKFQISFLMCMYYQFWWSFVDISGAVLVETSFCFFQGTQIPTATIGSRQLSSSTVSIDLNYLLLILFKYYIKRLEDQRYCTWGFPICIWSLPVKHHSGHTP